MREWCSTGGPAEYVSGGRPRRPARQTYACVARLGLGMPRDPAKREAQADNASRRGSPMTRTQSSRRSLTEEKRPFMPRRPLKACAEPGCHAPVRSGRCPAHDLKRQYYCDHPRGTSTARGYGQRWRKARARFLRAHPWCVLCGAPATVVDHREPHRGDASLFWDEGNWQPMCKPCHDSKTAREGRWGRRSDFSGLPPLGTGGSPLRDPVRVSPERSHVHG